MSRPAPPNFDGRGQWKEMMNTNASDAPQQQASDPPDAVVSEAAVVEEPCTLSSLPDELLGPDAPLVQLCACRSSAKWILVTRVELRALQTSLIKEAIKEALAKQQEGAEETRKAAATQSEAIVSKLTAVFEKGTAEVVETVEKGTANVERMLRRADIKRAAEQRAKDEVQRKERVQAKKEFDATEAKAKKEHEEEKAKAKLEYEEEKAKAKLELEAQYETIQSTKLELETQLGELELRLINELEAVEAKATEMAGANSASVKALETKIEAKETEANSTEMAGAKKELDVDEIWAANEQSEALAKARHEEALAAAVENKKDIIAAVRVGTEEVVKKVETEGEKNRIILSNQITKADRTRAAEQRAKDAEERKVQFQLKDEADAKEAERKKESNAKEAELKKQLEEVEAELLVQARTIKAVREENEPTSRELWLAIDALEERIEKKLEMLEADSTEANRASIEALKAVCRINNFQLA